MTLPITRRSPALALAWLALVGASACKRDAPQDHEAPGSARVATASAAAGMPSLTPDELASTLNKPGDKPLLFHVGFKKLYQQAHIPESEFVGPTSDEKALDRLRQRVASLPRSAKLVIYCGCCPWEDCPNMKPAYEALRELGFIHTKALYIARDFGADWVEKGYPVAKGNP